MVVASAKLAREEATDEAAASGNDDAFVQARFLPSVRSRDPGDGFCVRIRSYPATEADRRSRASTLTKSPSSIRGQGAVGPQRPHNQLERTRVGLVQHLLKPNGRGERSER